MSDQAATSQGAIRATQLVTANPNIVNDPAGAQALLNSPEGTGQQLGAASHFLSAYGKVSSHAADAVQSTNPAAQGFWGGLWHKATSVWDGISNAVGSATKAVGATATSPSTFADILHMAEGVAQAPVNAVNDVISHPGEVAQRAKNDLNLAGQTVQNLQSSVWNGLNQGLAQNAVNTHNLGVVGGAKANAAAARHGVAATVAANNPLAMSTWGRMAHSGAMFESMARQHGLDAAVAQFAPLLAASIVTHSALVGDVGTAAEADMLGGEANTVRASMAANEADANAAAKAARLAERGPAFQAADTAARVVTSPLRPFTSVAGKLMMPGADLRLNIMYALAHEAFANNPQTAAMWEATKNGWVVDGNGKAVATVGQGMTQALGLPSSDPLAKVLSNTSTLYAQMFGSDPYGAIGHVIGQARSAEGLGGILGAHFGGMAMTSPEDIYRGYAQYPRVRDAINYIAKSDTGEIVREMPGWFKGKSGSAFASALGKASTPEEVMGVFADAAEAGQMTTAMMPSISMTRLTMATFKNSERGEGFRMGLLGGRTTLGNVLGSDYRLLEANSKAIEEHTGFNVTHDNSNVYVAGEGQDAARIRTRATFGQWLGRQLGQKAWMVGKDFTPTGSIINVNDAEAGTMLATNLREVGMNRLVSTGVAGLWVDATEAERHNLIDNVVFHTIMRTVTAGMHGAAYDRLGTALTQIVRDAIPDLSGASSAGDTGVYINGEQGAARSAMKDGKAAGIDTTQLGQRYLIDPRTARSMALHLRDIVLKTTSTFNAEMHTFEHLNNDVLSHIAEVRNATLDGLHGRITLSQVDLPAEVDSAGAIRTAYEAKKAAILKDMREITSKSVNDSIGKTESFVNFYDKVRTDAHTAETLATLADEARSARNTLGETSATYQRVLQELDAQLPQGYVNSLADVTPEMHNTLTGEHLVLRDTLAQLDARLQDQAFTIDQIKSHVQSMREHEDLLTQQQVDSITKKYERLRDANPKFRSHWQKAIDGMNFYISRVWSPAALTNAGWALRVGASEALLNTYRLGARQALEGRIMASYVKHELEGGFFSSALASGITKVRMREVFQGSVFDMLRNEDLSIAKKMQGMFGRTVMASLMDARDIAGGTLHGIEHNLIKWTPRTERMVENFATAIHDFNGHLPMQIHAGAQILDNQALLYGNDEFGHPMLSNVHNNSSFAPMTPEHGGYPAALRESITRLYSGSELRPAADALAESLIKRAGTGEAVSSLSNKELIELGASKIKTPAQLQEVQNEVRQAILDRINNMDPAHKTVFRRANEAGKMDMNRAQVRVLLNPTQQQAFDALDSTARKQFIRDFNWADNIAYHTVSTVHGTSALDRVVVHGDLVHQATSGEIASARSYEKSVKLMESNGHIAPRFIAARQYQEGKWYDAIIKTSDWMHKNALGPIVNSLVRDPLFLMEFDSEMEKLHGLYGAGVVGRDEQKLMAYQNATQNMVKYVHNPLDKEIFEARTRAFFPFWFAQNQAWRRAFRVLREDPGSFEKLMRQYLMVTNYVSKQSQGGNVPIVALPGSELPPAFSQYFANPGVKSAFNLSMGFGADVGSVSSIIPTGPLAGMGILENVLRPSGGPVTTLLANAAKDALTWLNGEFPGVVNSSREKWATDAINNFIGPMAQLDTGLKGTLRELIPSTQAFNIYQGVQGSLTPWFGEPNASFNSAQIMVYNNAADNLQKEWFSKYYNADIQAGASSSKAEAYAYHMSLNKLNTLLNPALGGKFYDDFMLSVHSATTALYWTKIALGLGSPVSLSLQGMFSKEPQFQALLNEKKPDGTPKYTYVQALDKFTVEYPNHVIDLVAHTLNEKPGSSGIVGPDYAESQGTLQWIRSNQDLQKAAPFASALYSYATGQYSGPALALEKQLQLRTTESLPAYRDRVMQMIGDDWYYGVLKPAYPDLPGNAGYNNYKELTKLVTHYGNVENPTWGQYHGSGDSGKFAADGQTVKEVLATAGSFEGTTFKPNPAWKDASFGGRTQREYFAYVATLYQNTVAAYESATTGTARYNIESEWYNKMTDAMAAKDSSGDFIFSPQVQRFMQMVRTLPTK
ncbi:MAG: hypothetical protein HKL85_01285 [Acidimicrobiaceae bacterium]|nr:hypothetical protein [Acidimicrobiaceae bacterium]